MFFSGVVVSCDSLSSLTYSGNTVWTLEKRRSRPERPYNKIKCVRDCFFFQKYDFISENIYFLNY